MIDKPLSETHPTLWDAKASHHNGFTKETKWSEKDIQFCTVDIAEYQRLKDENSLLERAVKALEKQNEEAQSDYITQVLEIERLKKLVKELNSYNNDVDDAFTQCWYNEGVVDGERRAMEKVEWVLCDVQKRCIEDNEWVFETIKKDLGITKKVRK